MEITASEKKAVFKRWDESGVDLQTYNNAIKDKVSKLELILEKSKWELENRVAEEGYLNHLAQKSNQTSPVINEQEHKIHELEKEKVRLESQILSDKKIHELEKSNIELKAKLSMVSQGKFTSQKSEWKEDAKLTLDSFKANELKQEKILMARVNKTLHDKIDLMEKEKFKLETKMQSTDKLHELEKSNIELKTKLDNKSEHLQEVKQEKLLLSEKADSKEKTSFVMMKKYYTTIAVAGLIIGGFVGVFTFYENSAEKDYVMLIGEGAKSKYLVQNLKGDTLKTWFPWMLAGGQALHINILDNNLATPEKIDVIKNTILSEEVLDIDNSFTHKGPKGTTSSYYKGWAGALKTVAQQNTELHIPANFEVSNSKRPIGDITIELSSLSDPDGYSGYTKSVVDQGEILKSHIILYDVNSISNEQLASMMRHEFGHALGLAHSSAPEDLMYPVIETEFPYISECMVDAIAGLYDGKKSSEVVCQS